MGDVYLLLVPGICILLRVLEHQVAVEDKNPRANYLINVKSTNSEC